MAFPKSASKSTTRLSLCWYVDLANTNDGGAMARKLAFSMLPEFTQVGGLISYGTDSSASVRQEGIYIGRTLKRERPSDLPVVPPTKFKLVVDLQTARTLGLDISAAVLALADEVLE
jgi:putative ABC transport system substrate-binding protein